MNDTKCQRCLCQHVWKPTQRMLSLRFVKYFKYLYLSPTFRCGNTSGRYQKLISANCLHIYGFLLWLLLDWKSIITLCAPRWYLFLSSHSNFGVGLNLSSSSTIFQDLSKSDVRWRQHATSVHLLPPTLIFFRFKLFKQNHILNLLAAQPASLWITSNSQWLSVLSILSANNNDIAGRPAWASLSLVTPRAVRRQSSAGGGGGRPQWPQQRPRLWQRSEQPPSVDQHIRRHWWRPVKQGVWPAEPWKAWRVSFPEVVDDHQASWFLLHSIQ